MKLTPKRLTNCWICDSLHGIESCSERIRSSGSNCSAILFIEDHINEVDRE